MIHHLRRQFCRNLLRFSGKLFGWQERKVGQCLLIGPDRVVDEMEDAIFKVQREDYDLGVELLMTPWMVFSAGEKNCGPLKGEMLGIHDRWLAWGVPGIVACLVHAQTLRKHKLQSRASLKDLSELGVSDWLQARNYPEELVKCFHGRRRNEENPEGRAQPEVP